MAKKEVLDKVRQRRRVERNLTNNLNTMQAAVLTKPYDIRTLQLLESWSALGIVMLQTVATEDS